MADTRAIVNEITQELAFMVTVPTITMTTEEQQTALTMSGEHILHCVAELLEEQNSLLERLYNSEKERFNLRG